MFIELTPGAARRPAGRGGLRRCRSRNTLPDVNPDEFLSALDADTRDYLKLLLNGAAQRPARAAPTTSATVLKRFEPTYRDIARGVRAGRQAPRPSCAGWSHSLQRAQHRARPARTTTSPSSSTRARRRCSRAFAAERDNVAATVRELPCTLRQTTRHAEQGRARWRDVLAPDRRPAAPGGRARSSAPTRRRRPFALEAAPLLRDDIRPFVREARPLVRDLRPAARDLVEAEPDLKRTFSVLNHLFNLLGLQPGRAARARTRPTATRATSSTSPGSRTSRRTCSPTRTRTASSGRHARRHLHDVLRSDHRPPSPALERPARRSAAPLDRPERSAGGQPS